MILYTIVDKNALLRQEKSAVARFYNTFAPVYTFFRDLTKAKDEVLKADLLAKLLPFKNDRVLDVGTGPGVYALEIASQAHNSEVIGLDISEKFVAIAKQKAEKLNLTNVKFVVGQVEQLQFEDNYFTKVICGGILSLVKDRQKAVAEIFRVLAPGGVIVVREPCRLDSFLTNLVTFNKNKRLVKLGNRLGLMFGHFSPDFFTYNELLSTLKTSAFSAIDLQVKGKDLLAFCKK